MTKLTPTSYALLALLSRRSWSAYELNKHMQNSVLRAYWPRTESHVYSEPKKLVKAGLVTCTEEDGRGRGRTVYHITDEGRQRLRQWLAEPTDSFAMQQFEGMVKFICADAGDAAGLRQVLEDIRSRALRDAEAALHGIRSAERADAPEGESGMPFNALAINFLIDHIESRIRWVDEVQALLAQMDDTADSAANRALGEAAYERALARLADILA
jgi:DNA-binding PadR family transcriptional regulator